MRFRRLGHAGPELSVVGFGAWEAGGAGWGRNPPDRQVIEAVHAAIDAGVNWIDTAEIYGGGRSEELIGRAVAGRREQVLVATKVAPKSAGTGFRDKDVVRACRESLARLGTDRIDLYQLHWPDDSVPIEETWGAMTSLVDEGLVRWIGVSNFGRRLIARCEAIRHVDSLQPNFSLLRPGNRDLISWCGEMGIGVVTYSPLACALLTGAITAHTTFPRSDWRSGRLWESELYDMFFAPDRIGASLRVARDLGEISDRLGATPAQLALAWNFSQPGVTSAIAGTRDPAHAVEDSLAGDLELDAPALAQIEALVAMGPADRHAEDD